VSFCNSYSLFEVMILQSREEGQEMDFRAKTIVKRKLNGIYPDL
jgi:hypothetical protein